MSYSKKQGLVALLFGVESCQALANQRPYTNHRSTCLGSKRQGIIPERPGPVKSDSTSLNATNVGPQGAQLAFHILVAPVNLLNVLNRRYPFGAEGRQHHSHTRPNVGTG